jgi:predicted ABC-type ATPase
MVGLTPLRRIGPRVLDFLIRPAGTEGTWLTTEKASQESMSSQDRTAKTTFAREFLPHYADCKQFINADLIAQGMSPFSPEAAAFRAGRLMLEEIERYAGLGETFGFETTLSGLGHLRLLRRLKQSGYEVHFFFLWVPTVSLALTRVRDRVLRGGHNVPETIVRRRFERSIRNFLLR